MELPPRAAMARRAAHRRHARVPHLRARRDRARRWRRDLHAGSRATWSSFAATRNTATATRARRPPWRTASWRSRPSAQLTVGRVPDFRYLRTAVARRIWVVPWVAQWVDHRSGRSRARWRCCSPAGAVGARRVAAAAPSVSSPDGAGGDAATGRRGGAAARPAARARAAPGGAGGRAGASGKGGGGGRAATPPVHGDARGHDRRRGRQLSVDRRRRSTASASTSADTAPI